jgi:P-type Ca2+ transporter type 2C
VTDHSQTSNLPPARGIEHDESDVGLSTPEAQRRLAAEGPNALPSGSRTHTLRILRNVLAQPMFLLLIGGGLLYLLLGDPREGVLLFSLVLLTLGIDVYQEAKTERALRALRDMASPRAAVIRDGETVLLDSSQLVRGDVCLLHEGDRVPADGVLLRSEELEVDESLLTGESEAVAKHRRDARAPADRGTAAGTRDRGGENAEPAMLGATAQAEDGRLRSSARAGPGATAPAPAVEGQSMVYAGTTVARGHGVMLVTATGPASAIGRIGAVLHALEPGKSPLERQVSKLVLLFGSAGGAASLLLAGWYVATGGDWLDALLAGIALALSLLPEEFVMVLSVFPALGAWRLARSQLLTRRLSAIETLGTTSVLCVDKTGTLTENRMSVAALYADHQILDVDERTGELDEQYHRLVEFALLASPAESPDPMDRAVQRLGQRCLRQTEHLHPEWRQLAEYALTAQLRAVSHAWLGHADGRVVVAAKGAPEAIVDLCHLDGGAASAVFATVDRMAAEGLRVLGVATARFNGPPLPPHPHAFDFQLLGLIGFADPLRPGIADATAQCAAAGIRVVMITGDYPVTARHIAKQAGLAHGEIVTGDELARLSPEALRARLRSATVCARVAPEQKLAIVQALRADGEVVAMTGDGVNDAPALRAAHVGIAMGLRGTEVARQAASLVLLDDKFGSLVQAMRIGRQIFANMRKAMIYIVAVHVPTAGMALLPVLAGWPILLYPIHIVCLELLIAPTCSLAFESEAAEPGLMLKPPRDPDAPLLGWPELAYGVSQGLAALLVVFGTYAWALHHLALPQARAFAFVVLVVADVGLIFSNLSQQGTSIEALRGRNPIVWAVCAGAFAVLGLALYVPVLSGLFYFDTPRAATLAIAVLAGLCPLALSDLCKLGYRVMRRAYGSAS